VWQAQHFLHVAKTLAGVAQNERWFWSSCFVGAKVGESGRIWTTKGPRFCEMVVVFVFGHDDDSVW